MNIVFCTDKEYIKFLPTLLNSISQKNNMSDIEFHLLHNIEDRELLNTYEEYVSKKYTTKLSTYFINEKISFKNCLSHVTEATMLRLFIPDIIKTSGKILYLDLDIVVNADLNKIFNLKIGSRGISGKSSLNKNVLYNMSFKTLNTEYKTLNAGVLLMDLEILRKNNFTEKFLNIVKEHPYIDQVIINLYLEGEYEEIPAEYNIFNDQDDHLLKTHDDFILHYVGSGKPWNGNVSNKIIWGELETYI
ncbi:hypothetical protein M0P65_06850 [Candidatus Gracilibacteria bacterium]|nr:hypothetical protein [Candidatus Gracilibacteria bacterium]